MKILLTGGSGFIGSNLVRLLVEEKGESVINLDKLTYAGNAESLADLESHPNYHFERIDLASPEAMSGKVGTCQSGNGQRLLGEIFEYYQPDAVMHLAAESHVDRSIDGPGEFIQTNIVGTFNLLKAALEYWRSLPEAGSAKVEKEQSVKVDEPSDLHTFSRSNLPTKESFRFLHVSTDEVYGSLASDAPGFSETHAYDPHSPYSASKAASDHLVRAWGDTYGLPVLVTSCSNNYGPCQFPEKLIPVVILKCLRGEPIPVYGKGANIRDWLYVKDHAEALYTVVTKGSVGETYNIGGNNEQTNLDLIKTLCEILGEEIRGKVEMCAEARQRGDGQSDRVGPAGETEEGALGALKEHVDEPALPSDLSTFKPSHSKSFQDLITFVTDRPGHDMRYAIDPTKIRDELGWEPKEDFKSGFRKTVLWYLNNREWTDRILSGDYKLDRLGQS